MDNRIYLSRRNLEVLLSKLDRKLNGQPTACTIIKYRNEDDPEEYQQTMAEVYVTAVENDDLYVRRNPGRMHPADEPPFDETGTSETNPLLRLQVN